MSELRSPSPSGKLLDQLLGADSEDSDADDERDGRQAAADGPVPDGWAALPPAAEPVQRGLRVPRPGPRKSRRGRPGPAARKSAPHFSGHPEWEYVRALLAGQVTNRQRVRRAIDKEKRTRRRVLARYRFAQTHAGVDDDAGALLLALYAEDKQQALNGDSDNEEAAASPGAS